MSNAFTNFLGGVVSGVFNGSSDLKDFQHANRLYVANTYARAPKFGFLYFVSFEIEQSAIKDNVWREKGMKDVGLLVKRVDLPKFTISTDTINQYNRKTVIQTQIKYNTLSMEFHDDTSEITNGLWKNYYKYYYADGTASPQAFSDTKYGVNNYAYGLNNKQTKPFFKKINIYVLHQQKFTEISLINPVVTEWSHDTLNQDEGAKILANKMSISYESVVYNEGVIARSSDAKAFTAQYYDNEPSPLRVAGNGSLFGPGGVVSGATDVFGSLSNGNYLGALIQAKSLSKSVSQLNKAGLKQEGYSILGGVLGDISSTGNQPGSIGSNITTSINNGIANVGVKLFKNSTTDGQITAKPTNITEQ